MNAVENKLVCRIDSYDNYLSQLEIAGTGFFNESMIMQHIEVQRSLSKTLRNELFSGGLTFWDVCGQADAILGVNCGDLINEYEALND